jgi:hypothetical protein
MNSLASVEVWTTLGSLVISTPISGRNYNEPKPSTKTKLNRGKNHENVAPVLFVCVSIGICGAISVALAPTSFWRANA